MKARKPAPTSARPNALQTYRAGCERTWELASSEADLAYTDQAFPECPTCPHRVDPDSGGVGAVPFCTLRPVNAPHPFAGLAGLLEELDD